MAPKKKNDQVDSFSLGPDLIAELKAYVQAVGEAEDGTNKSVVVRKALKKYMRERRDKSPELDAAFTRIIGKPKIRVVGERDE